MKNENKRSKWIPVVLIAVLCVALIAVAVAAFGGSDGTDQTKNGDATQAASDPAASESTGPVGSTPSAETTETTLPDDQPTIPEETEASYEPVSVSTPYCSFSYSGEWEDTLEIEVMEDSGCIAFSALMEEEKIPLFDLWFDQAKGELLGYMADGSGGSVSVSVEMHELVLPEDWTEKDKSRVYGMQDEMNNIVAQLDLTDLPAVSEEDIRIETPYCTLCYRAIWKAYVQTEVTEESGYTVSFSAKLEGREAVRLFDVVIGGTGDSLVGTITEANGEELEVCLNIYSFVPDGSWSDAECNVIYGMLEDVNYILNELEENPEFQPIG